MIDLSLWNMNKKLHKKCTLNTYIYIYINI